MVTSTLQRQATAADIIKTDGILRFQATQTLSFVLPKFTGSSDAAFVFDGENFIGVVSSTQLLNSRSTSTDMKLRSIAKMPPKLSPSFSLSEIAKAMIDSKIHFLPVINNDQFLGIVSINRLLEYILENHLLNGNGSIIFSGRTLVTGTEDKLV
jgi:predicted transcriptional regulator